MKQPPYEAATRPSGTVRADQHNDAGARIRARRRALGITQADMSTQAKVSRQTVISLEAGDYAPSVFLALRVARLLDTTVEELWGN